MTPTSNLVVGNAPVAFLEWFAASVALVIIVTLIYVFVLNRSPPPEGLTQAKLENVRGALGSSDPSLFISDAENAVKTGDNGRAVELAVGAARALLVSIVEKLGIRSNNMNISDMAYLVQSKAARSPDITQPMYQLNLMHLKAAQLQPVTAEEAQWAISTSSWLSQLVSAHQISF
ncbi:MAG: hypothetical protein ACREBS_04370 [Nitrososphaerales archaeon]